MQDKIEKTIHLDAPVSRVWRAISDYKEFGQWFGVNLEAPFAIGALCSGKITYPGYEHLVFEVLIEAMEPESYFSLTWCPYSDGDCSYHANPHTLVEFRLIPTENGTKLIITESGFASLPDDGRQHEAFRLNSGGWDMQAQNITKHVAS